MKSLQLPDQLIKSLNNLGLLESEAKIYAALVVLDYANVGDLLEILDVSKPRIYTSLGTLEEKGLIVQTSPRPVIYQAVAPSIALKMIVENYETAKNEALHQFQLIENQKPITKPQPPLFYIFGQKNVEFKIKDMLENTKESIECRTSEKYLKYIEKLANRNLRIHLILQSENTEILTKLENKFNKETTQISLISANQTLGNVENIDEEKKQRFEHIMELMDIQNIFILIVDNEEILLIPPFKSDSIYAFSSTNEVMIYMLRQSFAESNSLR